jgi:hypothetical protein
MGLDISAYRQLTKVRPLFASEKENYEVEDETENSVAFYNLNDEDFPKQPEGIESFTLYEAAEEMGFRAGSYSGYNSWRNELAKVAGFKSDQDAWEHGKFGDPFYEVINFTDCDGVIGPKFAAKLAKDFADNQERAEAHAKTLGTDAEWFIGKYAEWREAFEMAADNGAVRFH